MIAKVFVLLVAVAVVHADGLLGVGAPMLDAGHWGSVSAQSTAINHVAPAASLAYGYGIAGAPLGYGLGAGSLGLGHGIAAGNLRANGIVGNGILASRYGSVIGHNAIGHGLLGGIGYGNVLGHGYGAGLGKAVW